ncbi:hypothetical protein A9Q80_00125 [Cycloclasticus sp. 46_83_sub15_T18]|nr:hypothetical protein A9Q80_00125 [Cycloclasticus sp. 46_83_sub15_T18]
MEKIVADGRGALVLIRNEEDDQSIVEFIHNQELKEKGVTRTAEQQLVDSRAVGVGCQILAELGIKKLKLLGKPTKFSGLAGFGIEIVEHVSLED